VELRSVTRAPHLLLPRPDSPAGLGYRFPAEWEPHAATWLSWPHNPATWPDKFEPIPAVWQELVLTLAEFEPVRVLAGGAAVMAEAQKLVGGHKNVTLHDIVTNDVWERDHGAMFLVGPADLPPALVDWEYNAWGGKYPPFDKDNDVPRQVAKITGRQRYTPGIILEGGAIDGNGEGTLLTTEECLLNPNRNTQLGRAEIEQYLADYCAARKVIWLGSGIAGDDTDGHIDELARFVGPTTVVCAIEPDPQDDNYEPLADNYGRLRVARDALDRPLEVIPIPLPRPIFHEGQQLPASYMNFYIANGVVIVPQFDDPTDKAACETLARLFPDRQIRGLRAVDLAWGLGAYHCITQQQPAS
jgi:agmatine deiminase